MTQASNPAEFVGYQADAKVLSEDPAKLPEAIGRPENLPAPSRMRGRLVGTGATLTAASLIIGVLLAAVGAIDAVANGIGTTSVIALVLGLLLVGTHWGWVHVAEATANSIEGRNTAEVDDRRRQWLQTVEPYARFEVSTSVGEDGSITIYRVAYRPATSAERRFTFVREVEHEEVHLADEPAAAVTERAELLRRDAAQDTERERERYQVAADAYNMALIDDADEQQRREAQRAASEALSRQINSNLRDPPLVE